MIVTPVKISVLRPPQDDLLQKIKKSKLKLREGDIVVITSKVVGIWQGRCIPQEAVRNKDVVAKQEAEQYLDRRGGHVLQTITNGVLISSAGVDASNGNGYYILWPENLPAVTQRLLEWFKREYRVKKLGLIITDSRSIPLRRGTIGFALTWAGFEPLYDYRKKKDVFGKKLKVTQMNLADSLAAAAVLMMGEAGEQTPLTVIRAAPRIQFILGPRAASKRNYQSVVVPMKEDLFAPFLRSVRWKKGRSGIRFPRLG